MSVFKLRGSTTSASELDFGRGARETGMGGVRELSSGSSVTMRRVSPWSGLAPVKRDLTSLAFLQSLPGVHHEWDSFSDKSENNRLGCDLNFVMGTLHQRAVTLSPGLTCVAMQTRAESCARLTAIYREQGLTPALISRISQGSRLSLETGKAGNPSPPWCWCGLVFDTWGCL